MTEISGSDSSADSSAALLDKNDGDESRIISARGTEDGLVVRIDGRTPWEKIVQEMECFLGERRRFLEGGGVLIEWLDRLPTTEQSQELEELLKTKYGIEVVKRRKRLKKIVLETSEPEGGSSENPKTPVTIPLFNAIEVSSAPDPARGDMTKQHLPNPTQASTSETRPDAIVNLDSEDLPNNQSATSYLSHVAKVLGDELAYDEEANARIFMGTLRSGQRLETPFSLVVIGDVNPGADLIAGGDIIVLGNLRGTAHASAYDDEGFEHLIVALQMQPMQLRIGSVISRGSDEVGDGPETARIEDRRIIVESFNSKTLANRKNKKSLNVKSVNY